MLLKKKKAQVVKFEERLRKDRNHLSSRGKSLYLKIKITKKQKLRFGLFLHTLKQATPVSI